MFVSISKTIYRNAKKCFRKSLNILKQFLGFLLHFWEIPRDWSDFLSNLLEVLSMARCMFSTHRSIVAVWSLEQYTGAHSGPSRACVWTLIGTHLPNKKVWEQTFFRNKNFLYMCNPDTSAKPSTKPAQSQHKISTKSAKNQHKISKFRKSAQNQQILMIISIFWW